MRLLIVVAALLPCLASATGDPVVSMEVCNNLASAGLISDENRDDCSVVADVAAMCEGWALDKVNVFDKVLIDGENKSCSTPFENPSGPPTNYADFAPVISEWASIIYDIVSTVCVNVGPVFPASTLQCDQWRFASTFEEFRSVATTLPSDPADLVSFTPLSIIRKTQNGQCASEQVPNPEYVGPKNPSEPQFKSACPIWPDETEQVNGCAAVLDTARTAASDFAAQGGADLPVYSALQLAITNAAQFCEAPSPGPVVRRLLSTTTPIMNLSFELLKTLQALKFYESTDCDAMVTLCADAANGDFCSRRPQFLSACKA